MKYKTVVNTADQIDNEVNALVEEGWVVMTTYYAGDAAVDVPEVGKVSIPVIVYVMFKDDAPEPVERRRFIGSGT